MAQFTGAKACAVCHPEIAASHASTGHAKSLSPGEHADWAFGTGRQAITYVNRVDDEHYLELGLTLYTATKKLGITPGHSSAKGDLYRVLDPSAAMLRCFQCHSTGTLRFESGRILPAELGVQCEDCHGAGKDHRALINPGKLTAAALNDLCGACHRKAGTLTNWGDPWNVRHQPVYLAQSPCFLKSSGRLSCTTCHAAHQPVSGGFDSKCAACHQSPKHVTAIAGKSCVQCHMPAVRPSAELAFANHWIGIYKPGSPLLPVHSLP